MAVSFDGANTEVFGNSMFNTEDTPLRMQDLDEGVRHIGNFRTSFISFQNYD